MFSSAFTHAELVACCRGSLCIVRRLSALALAFALLVAPAVKAAVTLARTPLPPAAAILNEARVAYARHRIVAPAGHNATHYYLEVLSEDPNNQVAADALREIFPYAVPTVRRAIADHHVTEARREIALLARADPSNYTLTLLRRDLARQTGGQSVAIADAIGANTLTIRASGTCRIELRRSDNQVIDARLLHRSDVRTYYLAGPVRLTLGYANAVMVVADGKRLHLPPATPGNSEHLVLFRRAPHR